VLLRLALFVAVARLKQQLSFVLKVNRFCVSPAVRAGTFTFSQARSESGAISTVSSVGTGLVINIVVMQDPTP
jgi:hypothetical protein